MSKKRNIMKLEEYESITLLEDYLKDVIKDIVNHSERVLDICKKIVNNIDFNEIRKNEKEFIFKAAIFHDIAKFKKEHNKKAKKILKKFFNEDDKDFKKICQIIKNHRDEFDPDEDIAIPAAILRMADKIDKFNKKQSDAEEKYLENLDDIKEYFEKNGIKKFKTFKEACEIVKEEIIDENN